MGNFVTKMFGATEEHLTHARNTNAVSIVGKEENKIGVSFDVLINNFGYFNYKNFFKNDDKPLIFKFPKISESTTLSVLEFVEKGKHFLSIFINERLYNKTKNFSKMLWFKDLGTQKDLSVIKLHN